MNSNNTLKPVLATGLATSLEFAHGFNLVEAVSKLIDSLGAPHRHPPATVHLHDARAVSDAIQLAAEAQRRLDEQAKRIAYLERLAHTDELTGLLNRRGFEDQLHKALAASRRYGEKGVLVYIDLDGFKPVNDTYGHAAGDEVLRQLGRLLTENVRDTDSVGRLGGDEFAVLLTHTGREDGLARAEKLDRMINSAFVSWNGWLLKLGASFGIQTYGPADEGAELMKRADQAMYQIKKLRTAERQSLA